MLPLRENALWLEQVAHYWSRELNRIRTDAEIYRDLFKAIWKGELQVFIETEANKLSPRRLLELIRKSGERHPGFVLVERPEDIIPPRVEDQPDGSALVHLDRYVVLPEDPHLWTNAVVEDASAAMADVPIDGFGPAFLSTLRLMRLTRTALAGYCDRCGFHRPKFWFAPVPQQRWTVRDERELRKWLRRVSKGSKQKTKSTYFVEAKKEFPRLPRRAFDRAWNDSVPDEWKQAGAPIKSAKHDN